MKNGVKPVARLREVLRLQTTAGSSLSHLFFEFVQTVEDPGFQTLEDHAIGTFYLTVGLWVSNRYPVHMYVVSVAELQEFPPGELCAIISDNGVGHSNR